MKYLDGWHHTELELQTLAGMRHGLVCRPRGTGKTGEYYVVFDLHGRSRSLYAAKAAFLEFVKPLIAERLSYWTFKPMRGTKRRKPTWGQAQVVIEEA
jgi:hypothetical protein